MGIQVKGILNKHPILSIPANICYWADRINVDHSDPVELWPDVKGGYDAPSVTATDAVLTKNIAALNGHAAVTFSGAQGYQNALFSTSQPITIIGVWNVTSIHKSYLADGAETDYQCAVYWRDDSPDVLRVFSNTSNLLNWARPQPTSYVITMVDFNGASSAIYEGDPTTAKVTGNAGTSDVHGITIGSRHDLSPTYALTGNIPLLQCVIGGLNASGKARAFQIINDYYGIY